MVIESSVFFIILHGIFLSSSRPQNFKKRFPDDVFWMMMGFFDCFVNDYYSPFLFTVHLVIISVIDIDQLLLSIPMDLNTTLRNAQSAGKYFHSSREAISEI